MQLLKIFTRFWAERSLIFNFAKKDFTSKYLGSYLGIMWAFIQPTIMIMIYWFVFQVGFRSVPIGDIPFILWLLTGMIPWLFFSETIAGGTSSVVDNSYLVKKVVFPIEILPIVRLISASFVHLFFICILIIIFCFYGYYPNLYFFQYFYYFIATVFLGLGITYITSCLTIFIKDVGQFVNMFLQFGFWLTPIFWSFDLVPEKLQFLFKINPLFYIIDGFRQTFIYHTWFWERPIQTIYFWSITVILFLVGVFIFSRVKKHFADVL